MNMLRRLRRFRRILAGLMLASTFFWSTAGYADTLIKTNSGANTFLNSAVIAPNTAYIDGAAPTAADIILFNNLITGATTFRINNSDTAGAALAIAGLAIGAVGGNITIQNGGASTTTSVAQTLQLGTSGIDMSAATANLIFSNLVTGGSGSLTVELQGNQTWNVNTGRNITFSNGVAITGSGGTGKNVTMTGGGSVTLQGSYTTGGGLGAVTVANGTTLNIDQAAASQNKLADTLALTVNRSTINLAGTGPTSPLTETVGSLVIGEGASLFTRSAGTGVLQSNAITRSVGGTMRVNVAGILTTDNTNVAAANGILGGWAVFGATDWLVNTPNTADGAVGGLAAGGYKDGVVNPETGWVSGDNITLGGSPAALSNNRTIASLRATAASTINLGGFTLAVESGGIMTTGNNNKTISNGTLTAGNAANEAAYRAGAANNELFFHQNSAAANNLTVSAVIADNPSLAVTTIGVAKTGGGLLIFTGDNTYTGQTTISEGTLQLGNNTAGGDVGDAGSGAIVNYGTLAVSKTAASILGNNVSGIGGLTKSQAAQLTLNGNNTYSGATTLNAGGLLIAGNATAFSPNSQVVMNSAATLDLGGFNNSVGSLSSNNNGSSVSLGANTLTISGNNAAVASFQGAITGGGNLIKSGTGVQNLTGTGLLSYTGTTTVSGGTLQTDKAMTTSGVTVQNSGNFIANVADALANAATVNLANAGSTYTVNFSDTIASLTGVTDSRVPIASGQTLTILDNGGAPNTFNGIISGLGGLAKDGTNTYILAGGNSHTGATTINTGILRVDPAAVVQVLSDRTPVVLANVAGAALELSGKAETIGSLAGGGAAGGNVALGAGGALTTGRLNTSTSFDGTITGTGASSLTKEGTGTMTLTGANSFATLNVNGGGIILNNAGGNALADTTAVRVNRSGSILALNSNETIGSINAARNSTIDLGAGATLTLTTPVAAGSAISSTTVASSRVVTIPTGTAGLAEGMFVNGTGITNNTRISQILSGTTILLDQVATSAGTNSLTYIGSDAISGNVTGTGGITKNGGGELRVTGSMTQTGALTINEGPLATATTLNESSLLIGSTYRPSNTLSDTGALVIGTPAAARSIDFVQNATNLATFERIGSLAGGNVNTAFNLVNNSGAAANIAMIALGGAAVTDTSWDGIFTGDNGNAWVIKEGGFKFTVTRAQTNDGFWMVDNGALEVGGALGALDDASYVQMQNRTGTSYLVQRTDTIEGLLGGGKGATRGFSTLTSPNVGFAANNYISGTGGSVAIASGATLTVDNDTAGRVNQFGGVISGLGGLTKTGRSTLELLGANTYTGTTTVNNNVATDNLFSTIRLAAYGAAAGLGSPGSGGQGSLAATSSLVLVTGGGGTNRSALFDLAGASQTLNSLTSSGTSTNGGNQVSLGIGSLTINTLTGSSGVFNGNISGVGNVNVLATLGANGWDLTGGNTFTGALNIASGLVRLNQSSGNTLADASRVFVGPGAELRLQTSDVIGSIAGSGLVTINSTRFLTVAAGASGSLASTGFAGAIAGAGDFQMTGGGLRLSGNTTLSGFFTLGATSFAGGTAFVVLDYTGGATDILPSSTELGGATLFINGNSIAETVGTTTLFPGATQVARLDPLGTGRIEFGNIVRNQGSTLQVVNSSASTSLAAGVIGGYAVYGTAYQADTWAVSNGAGVAISGLGAGSYTNNVWSSGIHTNVAGSFSGTGTTETLRFNAPGASTVTLTGAALNNTINSGGILVTANVGGSLSAITSTVNLGANNNELIIHQHNPLGALLMDVEITDNPGFVALTKAGPGTVILARDNTFSGRVYVDQGRLQVGNGGTTGTLGGSTQAILNNGVIAVNRSNDYDIGQSIDGTGWLIHEGSGKLRLSGNAGTFSGTTTVAPGRTLEVAASTLTGGVQSGGLGSAAGLTSVGAGGLVDLGGGGGTPLAFSEVFALKGAGLQDNTTAGTATILSGSIFLLGASNTVSSVAAADVLNVTAPIIGLPDTSAAPGQQPAGLVIGGSGITSLESGSNSYAGTTTINAGATLRLGNNSNSSIGTGAIINNGTVATNNSNGHLVLSNDISGSGGIVQGRNTVYLTGENGGHNGGLTVGDQSVNAAASLRIGNDTYGSINTTGPVTLQATTGAAVDFRYHLIADNTITGNVTINANSDGTTARNATLLRQGIGNITLAGDLTIGATNAPAPGSQRAVIQTEGGGKLTLAQSSFNGSAANIVNIVNNGIVVIGGSGSNSYHGVLSGNNVWVFQNSGATTLLGVNTFNTGNTYVQKGTLVVGTGGVDTIQNDNDMHILRGATLNVVGNETIGDLFSQRGATVDVAAGSTLTVDDNTNGSFFGSLTGGGNVTLGVYRAMYGASTNTGTLTLGTGTTAGSIQTANLTNAIGSFSTINLGAAGNTGAGVLEYIGSGETFAGNLNLSGTTATVRITANGNGALTLSGNITNTGAGNKTLQLSGQSGGYFNPIKNQITGAITEGANVLTLSMPNTGNDDRFGLTNRWALTNSGNDFSGGITVNVGMLELGGDLGTGGAVATSQLGDLSVARTFDIGTNNFDGRRYDMFGSGDQIGAAGSNQGTNTLTPNSGSTGTLIFNSTNAATFTLPSNITLTQSFSSTTNPGSGQIINDGSGAVIIQGNLTSGASGNRVWFLDGTNTGANEISGLISGSNVGITKEGAGTWRLSNAGNTYGGTVTVNNGILELGGPVADGATVALNADGGDGLYSGTAKVRLLVTDTIGALTGDIGSEAEIGPGAVITAAAGSATMNGIITGGGGYTRTDNDTTNNRITTFANKNTYDGVTTITTAGANNRTNRIDVVHLADGGVASGIGDSSNAAANLVIAMGSNGGGLRWIGFTNQSTDRLLTIGNGATGTTAHIWGDGQVVGDFAPKIEFTNTGALAIGGTSAQAITLRGGTIADNLFAPQINNGAAATSLNKIEGGLWILSNANGYTGGTSITGGTLAITNGGALGTGTVAINGGAGVGLQIRGGAGGITVANNVTNGTSQGGIHVTGSGGNTMSGTMTFNGTNAEFRVNVDNGATLNLANQLTGGGLGTGSLLKFGNGTLNLAGANNYSAGSVIVAGGTLGLDYSAQDNSKLRDAGALNLGWTGSGVLTTLGADNNVAGITAIVGQSGGRVNLIGGVNGHVETVSNTVINQGSNSLNRASGTSVISLGAVTRTVGGNLDVTAGNFALTDTVNGTGNILLPGSVTVGKADWAVSAGQAALGSTAWTDASNTINQPGFVLNQIVKFSGATVPAGLTANVGYYVVNPTGTDFQVALTPGGGAIDLTNSGTAATLDRPGFISALAPGGYTADAYASGNNTDVVAFTALAADSPTNTLRFNQAGGGTLDLGGFTLSSQSAGLLMTPNSGNVIIQNGFLRNNATTAAIEAINIHQHSSNALQIDAVIQNNTGAQTLTKTGTGKVFLNAANTYTGVVNLHEGEIQVGGTIAAPGTATNAALGVTNAINLSAGTTLTFNSSNASLYNTGVIQGEGLIQTTAANTQTLLFDDDNGNFTGEIIINGATTVQVNGNNNALGSNRGRTTFNTGSTLQINDSRNLGELITYGQGVNVTTLAAAAATLSGVQTMNNTTSAGLSFNIPLNSGAAGTVGLNISGLIRASNGFTKTGNGILQISANNFSNVHDGFTALGATGTTSPTLMGQININGGILYVGGARALGATGAGNETIIANGATIDLRGQALNYGDDSDPAREVIQVQGTGFNGTGALRNTTGTGQISFLTLDGDATLNSGGFANSSALILGTYDTNLSNANGLTGAFTRNRPVIEGNNNDLTIAGARNATDNVIFADPSFASALSSMNIQGSSVRFRHEVSAVLGTLGVGSTDITGGITIGYAGQIAADLTGATAGLGAHTGARLMFENYFGTHHTVDITMDGALAGTNNGHNYLEVDFFTIPDGTTYLDGDLNLTGTANRNFIISNSLPNFTVAEQGNTTVAPVTKMVIGGVVQGTGGFTKIGFSETRLTANNTFSGDVNVLRFGTSSSPWSTYNYKINGVDYQTQGLAEGWAEWGLTLNGPNGAISDAGSITLQRRGMITLDNTGRLDATSAVTGANNNNRIADDTVLNLDHGWLRINGGTASNTEAFGTVNVTSGTNIFDLYPTDGAGTDMDIDIATLNRSAGGILRIQNLDATSTFSTSIAAAESVRVGVATLNAPQLGGGGAADTTTRSIVQGILGGTIPLGLDTDLRILGYNNGNVSDLWNQQRNLQFLAGSHFMTYEGGFLRPLDDDEYFTPANGILSTAIGANQNVNLNDVFTVMKENTAINSLRFGPLSDNDGSGGALNATTTLTSYTDHHAINLMVDGVLKIDSGMISSAYFTAGNTSSLSTVILGGALDFNGKEAIINNQNGLYRLTDGLITTGNLEIRSDITNAAGLTKTGLAQVVLDGNNTYTGVTTVNDGVIFVRNGRTGLGAGGAGNGVVITGNGSLNSGNGIQIGTPAAREDIYIGALQGDQQIMRVDNDTTVWYSNLTVDNIDVTAQTIFTPRIRTDAAATSIIYGNIGGGSTAITNDVLAIDSRVVQFDTAGNNTFILRGQFGDKIDGSGNAVPIPDPISTLPTLAGTRTNENEVLRVTFAGVSLETNYFLDRQYNAVGRLTLNNGNLFVNYNPAGGGLDGTGFWTNTALSKIPNADSTTTTFTINGSTTQQGFTLAGGGVFMTTPGQVFNMASWSTSGTTAKFIGGINQSDTVTYGNGTGSLTTAGAASQLYALDGGTVVFNQRLTGNVGTAPNNFGVIKIGRGTVELQSSTLATAADSNISLAGGTLILNHDLTNVARVGNQNAAFGGGVIRALSNLGAATLVNLATDNAADRVAQFLQGGTEIIAETRSQNMTVNIGNGNANNTSANLTRAAGSTVNLVENNAGGGVATITLNFNGSTTAASKNALIPWATTGTAPRTATDFAMSDAGAVIANDVKPYNRAPDEEQNDATLWQGLVAVSGAAGADVSENGGSGFRGTLTGAATVNSLHMDANADSLVNLNGNTLTVTSGGIMVASSAGAANKTFTGGTIAGTELIMHHYGSGNLTIGSTIAGTTAITVTGPSTTNAVDFGTTGTVMLTGTNTTTGKTYVNGGVLSISSQANLGAVPGANVADQLTLNGGTLRFTGTNDRLTQNRGVTIGGNGGVIEVVNPDGNLFIETSIASAGTYRGDLIKTGAGTLTLEADAANQAAFAGMIDVRQGTLRLAGDDTAVTTGTQTKTMFGSTQSLVDGTILRNGTNLMIQMGAAGGAIEWAFEEWLTFEGNNRMTIGTVGAAANRLVNLNGPVFVNGTLTIDLVQGQTARFNTGGSGFVSGNGDIIKVGQGQFEFRANSPDWTGNLIIEEGRVYGLGQADVLGTGYLTGKTVTLGSTQQQGIAELFMNSESAVHNWKVELNHDVNVVYNPAQTKRLAFETMGNGGVNLINGDITLNDNLYFLINDAAENGGSQNYVQMNGQLRDGAVTSGNLVVVGDDAGGANDNTSGRTVNYLVLNNDNSAWTGDLHINDNTTYDQDETTVVRLGHSQALTAATDVVMNFNSILQVGGQTATIGGLTTNGGNGPFFGDTGTMSGSTNHSSEIIENAAVAPGALTISQTTPATFEAVWDAKFRDGTLNSQFFAPGANEHQPAAALSIVKEGAGWATMTLDNDYTGNTTVAGGILQVGRNGVGDTGAATAAGTIVSAAAILAGTGVVQGGATVNATGEVRPGDNAGTTMGTLTFNGNTTLTAGSITTLQVQRPSYNNANHFGYNGASPSGFATTVATDIYSSALSDPILSSQHDAINVLGALTWSVGSKIVVQNNGYTPVAGDIFDLFDWFSIFGAVNRGADLRIGNEGGTDLELFELGGDFRWDTTRFNTDGYLVVTLPGLIPEPSRALLLFFGLLGIFFRRRRAC